MNSNSLDTIYFVKLPKDFKLSNNALNINPEIPLPVQKKDRDDSDSFNMADLSEEQILAGILTVLAYDTKNENLDYYRDFIKKVRPNLKKELAEAAILKTKNEEWDLAEEIWMSLHGLDPEDKAIVLNMALFFDQKADSYRKGNLFDDADAYDSTALEYYKNAMNSSPELPDAFFNAGFFYLKQRNFKEAKSCFENYVALTADFKDDELGENGIYKKERAQELINKISNRNLENERFYKANELIKENKLEEALEQIRLFTQDNPNVWNAWFMMGWIFRRMERYQEAMQAFTKAQEFEGGDENPDTLNELAICQMETGDFKGAKENLYKALSIDGDNIKVISNLGYLSLKTGDTEDAKGFFNTVLEISPDDKIAQYELSKLND
ncbi:MAG: tetratricopeptide repeat protein [Spirochaetia bacterium]|nr:tetratricopeptide repeat protein [Spirochaetia bacterium]